MRFFAAISIALFPAGGLPVFAAESQTAGGYREAATKAIALLQSSGAVWAERSACTSCHHQSLPLMAIAIARQHGIKIDESLAAEQARFSHKVLSTDIKAFLKALQEPTIPVQRVGPNPHMIYGYTLLGLSAASWGQDDVTDAAAAYLAASQQPDGNWTSRENRPPLEASAITATAIVARTIQDFTPSQRSQETAGRIDRARNYLTHVTPKDNEDRVFRLLGFLWTHADRAIIEVAASDLLADQHDDGGWSQLSQAASDAYATGQALVALHESGASNAASVAYRKGVDFLLKTQLSDGSWMVHSRSKPFQPHFETGFPHGKDQFISCAATSWAAMAIAFAVR